MNNNEEQYKEPSQLTIDELHQMITECDIQDIALTNTRRQLVAEVLIRRQTNEASSEPK